MVYETADDAIVVDMGVLFPSLAEFPGIDFIIPNIDYVSRIRHKLRALIITHGHEDHIGGLPYHWPKLGVPIYATPLTKGLIEVKFGEFGVRGAEIRTIRAGDVFRIGSFQIEAIRLNHSIPDNVGFAIETPEGVIIQTGDFKFDPEPVFDDPSDIGRLKDYSRRGVLALLSDSTNAERPGRSISEKQVGEVIDEIFAKTRSRIIVTTFASLINRVQQTMNAARKSGRRVALTGYSLEKNVEMAMKLGTMRVPEGLLIPIHEVRRLPDERVCIISTGSQGEEMSALYRMASGEHRQVRIRRGDTVLLSASKIPGNERAIYNVIDNLMRLGATVVYREDIGIHVSGHGNAGDLQDMIAYTQPRYHIPVHGEYHHLIAHARLAQEVGIPAERTLIFENGQVIEFRGGVGQVSRERINASYVLVDGLGIGDVGEIVLRDRQAMAKDGIFLAILTVDRRSGRIIKNPDIISRGFVYMRAAEDLIDAARLAVRKIFERHRGRAPMEIDYLKRVIRDGLGEFLFRKTERRPMVIPVIIEV